jgi:hypothetical protein
MCQNFVAENEESLTNLANQLAIGNNPNREILRVLIISSRQGVTNAIHNFYRLGFAEVHEWSPLLPTANAGQFMSILTRQIAVS